MVYDPYGQTTFLSPTWATLGGSAFGWVYLHQGGRFDGTSGLYDFRSRAYSSTLGRWTAIDSLGFQAGDKNLYRYVANHPTRSVDPTGTLEIKIFEPFGRPRVLTNTGQAQFGVFWALSEKEKTQKGTVIQHVTMKYDVKDGCGNDVGKDHSDDFWEGWQYGTIPDKPTWFFPDANPPPGGRDMFVTHDFNEDRYGKTKGHVLIKGIVKFVEDYFIYDHQTKKYINGWNEAGTGKNPPPTKPIPWTREKPKAWTDQGGKEHILEVRWDNLKMPAEPTKIIKTVPAAGK